MNFCATHRTWSAMELRCIDCPDNGYGASSDNSIPQNIHHSHPKEYVTYCSYKSTEDKFNKSKNRESTLIYLFHGNM